MHYSLHSADKIIIVSLAESHFWIIYWVIPEKIHTPQLMRSFFWAPSHLDFLKHKTPPPPPPSCLDFQDKRPLSRLDFQGKNIRLKFNLFLIENMHNHL